MRASTFSKSSAEIVRAIQLSKCPSSSVQPLIVCVRVPQRERVCPLPPSPVFYTDAQVYWIAEINFSAEFAIRELLVIRSAAAWKTVRPVAKTVSGRDLTMGLRSGNDVIRRADRESVLGMRIDTRRKPSFTATRSASTFRRNRGQVLRRSNRQECDAQTGGQNGQARQHSKTGMSRDVESEGSRPASADNHGGGVTITVRVRKGQCGPRRANAIRP